MRYKLSIFLGWPCHGVDSGLNSTGLATSLGLGCRLQNLPRNTCLHFQAARKGGRNQNPCNPLQASIFRSPGGSKDPQEGVGSRNRPRYHSSNLVLGGASAWSLTLGSLMITANDPCIYLHSGSKVSENHWKHTNPTNVGVLSYQKGLTGPKNPVTLHWCRDQDTDVCLEMYAALAQVEILVLLFKSCSCS